jgi:apolipoprotein D and lipocalin family protein
VNPRLARCSSSARTSHVLLLLLLVGCATGTTGIAPRGLAERSLPMDLSRYMGDWFVIAHIPTSPEADAYEAVERYTLLEDGTIDVQFRFCEGGLDGPPREITMRAWVHDPTTNAEWRVRPFWPLSLRYQIVEIDPDFETTVVVSGEHAWVMARRPEVPEGRLAEIVGRLEERGFDVDELRRVPHSDGACRDAA